METLTRGLVTRDFPPGLRIASLVGVAIGVVALLNASPVLPTARAGDAGTARPAVVAPSRPIRLFNGTNLAGFHSWLLDGRGADPRRVFGVTNGLLRISGDGLGYLASESEYQNYKLIVEFRWGATNFAWGDRVGKARDSGVFVHATGPDGNSHDGGGAFMAAIECQIMEGAIGDFLLIRGTAADGSLIAPRVVVETALKPDADGWPFWQPAGAERTLIRWGRVNRAGKSTDWRDAFGFRDSARLEAPPGEWNRLEIECAGDRIAVRLNGQKVNEARNVSPSHGRILLQCEGSEILFRRVEVRSPDIGVGSPQ